MKTKLPTLAKMKLENNFIKKMCCLLVLFSGMAFGQIVNIPNTNFKAKLLAADPSNQIAYGHGVYIKIDSNNDGNIQLSEALNVTKLDVGSSGITDMTGIQSFSNLTYLSCTDEFGLTSLNVSNLTNLITLQCYDSGITSLNLTGLVNLQDLYCQDNQITLLNLNNLTNLKNLWCLNNLITNINLNGCINLQGIECENNLLTNVDLTGLVNLMGVYFNDNQISNIAFNNLSNLSAIYCKNNLLTNVSVVNCPILNVVDFSNNQLNTINFIGNTNAIYLSLQNNQLINLDLSSLSSLSSLNCSNNLFTSIDISNNHNFGGLICTDCPNLISVFMKFGRPQLNVQGGYPLTNNPNLRYVCMDDFRIPVFLDYFNQNGISNVVVNSYCSFTPGGNFNTITGSMIFDANNNGCDTNDLPQPNIRVNITDGTNTAATFTNNIGNYTFYPLFGGFILSPDTENPTWFTFSPPTATIPFSNTNNNSVTQNFCIAAIGVHNDVEVVVEPIWMVRPGFDVLYKVVYKNKGNQMLSGDVSFTYDDSVLDFVSATLAPTSQSTGLLNCSYTNLLPFENRSFYITLHVNTPTDTPPVNIGDILSFNAFITPVISDENPLDNAFTLNQTVVGSFDPNNISCLEGAVVSPSLIGSYLHYGVNFENTGTSQAQNIVVKVVIDTTKYDVNSLQMLNTSNPAYIKITGNVAEFIFQNIMLGTGCHGDVLFKIKTLNSLNAGDMVTKNADIFFDYNAPINTGMANTTFELLNNGQFTIDNSIVVSPNPTASNVTINGNNNIKSVQVYDVQGRLLETKVMDDLKTTINLSEKTNGIYFLKITSDTGSKVEKIVKE